MSSLQTYRSAPHVSAEDVQIYTGLKDDLQNDPTINSSITSIIAKYRKIGVITTRTAEMISDASELISELEEQLIVWYVMLPNKLMFKLKEFYMILNYE